MIDFCLPSLYDGGIDLTRTLGRTLLKRSSRYSSRKASTLSVSFPRVLKLPVIPLFLQIIGLFILWALYRTFFQFPEWVDEIFVKAVVFGGPAFLYARRVMGGQDKLGLSVKNFWCGMYFGLFIGGLYGFVGVLRSLMHGVHIEPIPLFSSSAFWYQFFLAIMTAWWESLFFFGYIMNALKEEYRLPEVASVIGAMLVFVVFHAPLRILLGGWSAVTFSQLAILGIFAVGQSILFLRTRSIFSVTLSHALWGMVLLVYGVQ